MGTKLSNIQSSSKTYWKILKKLINKTTIPRIPPLFYNNRLVVNCRDKASLVNDYFLSQCSPIDNNSVLPDAFEYTTENKLCTISFEKDYILSMIRSMNPYKSHGFDNLSIRMLQLCGDAIIEPLSIIFQNVIDTGIYPEGWKYANITPIHKKNNKQEVKNYRPISLLPVCAKLFEKIVFQNIYNHMISNNLLTKHQSGFRPGDSTTNQLLFLVHSIHNSFDHTESRQVRSVFLDISKAFDKVWHSGLLFKLKQNGIEGKLLSLMTSYLTDRKQRVILNGSASNWGAILSGVPQGSVLGPLLFLVYINDMENGIKSQIKFFADDTSLFSVVSNPVLSAAELNHDLGLIESWAFQWKMAFNPDPTKQAVEILFSRKTNVVNHPPLYFNNSVITPAEDHKHLGITLDRRLTFAKHIGEKIAFARKGIGLIRLLSSYVPTKTLDLMYKMFVRPHLDYCDVIFHIPPFKEHGTSNFSLNYLMKSIESTQYQAACAVTGAWKGTSLVKLYEELGWESLSDR